MIKKQNPTRVDSLKGRLNALRLFDFSGGLNTAVDPSLILENETPYAINCFSTENGAIKTRPGFTKLYTDSLGDGKIQGGAKFYTQAGNEYIMIAHGGKVYANTGTNGAYVAIKSSLHATNNYDFCQIVLGGTDYMVFSDRNGNLQKYNGTTVTQLVARVGQFPVWHKERLFVIDSDNNTLYASVALNPADFTTIANATSVDPYNITIGKGDGDRVMWLGVVNDNVTALKRNNIYVLFSADDSAAASIERTPSGIGTTSSEGVGQHKGIIYFPSEDGVYTFDGSLAWKISQKIQPDYDAIADKKKIVGKCFNGWYYMAYTPSGGTRNTEVLAYNIDERSWWKFTGIEANAFIEFVNGDDTEEFYFGHSNAGLVYKMFTGTNDAGVAIPMEFRTKYLDMGMPERKKRHRRIYPHFKTTTATTQFGYDHDFNNGPTYTNITTTGTGATMGAGFILGTTKLGTPGLVDTVRVPITGQSRFTQFRVRNSTLDQVVKFLGISDFWKPRRPV